MQVKKSIKLGLVLVRGQTPEVLKMPYMCPPLRALAFPRLRQCAFFLYLCLSLPLSAS